MAAESSVIVVSYTPGDWLESCVSSALDEAGEVVVVDNGSAGEEASSIARRLGARFVRCSKNLGFAGGAAVGLQEARGDVVAFLNDDALACPGWLSNSTAVLADSTVAAVTPKVLLAGWWAEVLFGDEPWYAPRDARPLGRQLRSVKSGGEEVLTSVVGAGVHEVEHSGDGGTWRWTAGGRPFYVPVADPSADVLIDGSPVEARKVVRVLNHAGSYLREHGVAGEYGFGAPDDGRFDEPAERFGFSGTAPVFRAETLSRLGGFASEFFAYNEDTDWCLRARLSGMRIVYEPAAVVTHRLSATSGGVLSAKVRFLAQRNSTLCILRNAPAPVARHHLWKRLREGSGGGVRRAVVERVPWALATRTRMRHRLWVTDPGEVWERWAENPAEMTWDTSPAEG